MKSEIFHNYIFGLFVGLLIGFFVWTSTTVSYKAEVSTVEHIEIESLKDSVEVALYVMDVKYPDIAFNQARQESNFNSSLFKRTNNLFGMMVPKTRYTTALNYNSSDRWAVYKSWKESVIDYCLWQSVIKVDSMTREEYLNYLEQNYGMHKGYANLIK